jgi:hypothetical protein
MRPELPPQMPQNTAFISPGTLSQENNFEKILKKQNDAPNWLARLATFVRRMALSVL